MKNKEVIHGADVRKGLKTGSEILCNAVKVTLGPKGRNVVIENEYSMPQITKDGVTVARSIKHKDSISNMGIQIVKEAAIQTNEVAGDGTTTATVLAQAIINNGIKIVEAGANPIELKRGIEKAVKLVTDRIKKYAVKIEKTEQIAQVGKISANHDEEIGKIIAEAMEEIGKDGVITVEENKSTETRLEIVEGMQFERGYLSPYFINDNANMQCKMENPYILLVNKKISGIKGLVSILEKIVTQDKPLLIIADDVEGEALATLVVNKSRGMIKVCAVKAPEFGDRRRQILEDIAILTGATLITEELGLTLDKTELEHLGTCRVATINNRLTTIVDGAGSVEKLQKRVEEIKKIIETTTSDYDREKNQTRLAKLAGGIAIINLGADTELELKEKRDRIDDALHATKAAVMDGIIPGGGIILKRISLELKNEQKDNELAEFRTGTPDENSGFDLLIRALNAPFDAILENAGLNGDAIWQKVEAATVSRKNNSNYGYDVLHDTISDFMESGIIDPVKVTITALEKAASAAGIFLTTEAIICNVPEEKKDNNENLMNYNYE